MALFHVARYPGPEAAEAAEGAGGRARVLLERLQSRARAREQEREQAQGPAATPGPGKRRRRPRRRRPGSRAGPESPDVQRRKRPKTGDGDAAGGRPGEEVLPSGTTDPAENGEGAGTSENEDEAPARSPSGEPPGRVPGTHALLLGGFQRRKTPKVQPFLPAWLAEPSQVGKKVSGHLVPIEDVPEVHPDLQKKLRAQGISSYFPVQAAVIPTLLESSAGGFLAGRGGFQPRDLCVSAPTGSGKTLAFVIPVVQALLHRVVCQVRALVVLPTKELAQQVSRVFNIYTDATPLRVALVTGQKPLAKEQESLVQRTAEGFRSLADIVVATPGRLVDHIDQTPGFSLQQLRFLVVDEADRMVDSQHQAWLARVTAAVFRREGPSDPWALFQRVPPKAVTAASTWIPQMPLQKLLFSATLTQNPEKLQQLALHQPQLFSTGLECRGPAGSDEGAGGKYTFPEGLEHHYVPCRLRAKPLAVLHLVQTTGLSRVLCFTNSREHSHRLFLLVQAFGGVSVAEFSSRHGPGQRKKILKQFEQGKVQLLVSTDATARGIDVPGVELVINYDAPQYARTYVHRVGRTARAGRAGQAFTLLLRVQEKRFLRMLAEAGAPTLGRHEIPGELLEPLVPSYEAALAQLEKTVREERKQKEA
ncbi:ATP-dependent RNA helicase DDX51 [Tenrec ecaudatus]|uniref:ATP-dependent RNA helicase DDX51 n=1 Tax=Tenrec ecaudatus TaxID=94439 RepID=UPI003F597E5E